MQKPRFEIQKYIAVYLIVNGLFLLLVNMIYIPEEIADFLLYAVGFLMYFVIPYLLLGLGYIHLVLNAGFLLYSVLKIILSKERNWVMFAVSVLAVAFSTWSNIFFLQH